MQKDIRAIFALSAIVLLLAILTIAVQAARGGFSLDAGGRRTRYGIGTYRATVCVYRYVSGGQSVSTNTFHFELPGFDIEPATSSFLGFGYGTIIGDSTGANASFGAIQAPIWAVALATLALTVWAVLAWRRTRPRAGFCRTCGYDLRESSGRCPECGALIPVSTSAAV